MLFDYSSDVNRLTVLVQIEETGREAGYGLLTSIVRKALLFVFGILLVRVLGAELYGVWVAFDTVLRPASVIAMMGGSQLLIKELSEARSEGDTERSTNFTAAYLVVVVSVGMVLCFPLLIKPELVASWLGELTHLDDLFLRFGWLIPIAGIFRMAPGALVGYGKVERMFTLHNILEPIAKFVGLAALWLIALILRQKWPYILVPEMAAIGALLFGTAIALRSEIQVDYVRIRAISVQIRRVIRRGTPLAAHALAGIAFGYTDRAMIAGMVEDPVLLSAYSICLTVAILVSLFHRNIVTVVSPRISEAHQKGEEDMVERLYRESAELSFLLAGGAYICLLFLGPEVLALYGGEFTDYVLIVSIVGWAYLFDTFAGCGGYLLVATGRERLLLYNSIISIVVNIVLNWVLISQFGIYGGAVATVISYSMKNLLIVVENYLLDGYHPMSIQHLVAAGVFGVLSLALWGISVHRSSLLIRGASTVLVVGGLAVTLYRRQLDILKSILPAKLFNEVESER